MGPNRPTLDSPGARTSAAIFGSSATATSSQLPLAHTKLVAMASNRFPKTVLSKLEASCDEAKIARERLSRMTTNEKKSLKACMRHYLKQNPDPVVNTNIK